MSLPSAGVAVRPWYLKSWVKALLILLFWTLPGLLLASQIFFLYDMEGRHVSWWTLVLWQVPSWWFWALATAPILWLGRRVTVERPAWLRGSAIHLGSAALISLLHVLYAAGVTKLVAPEPYSGYPFDILFQMFLLQRLHFSLLIYAAILSIGYGVDYYRKYRERELQASELQAQLAHAQLQALKMQLHPHFLFNTLNAIAMLVRKGANDQAVRMLAGLSDLLRMALEKGGTQEVSLRQELEFLERYLELQQIRFQDRLDVRLAVEPDTLGARVPNLILQPLVENAIRHGIDRDASAGLVAISARRDGGRLRVEVRDDGPGLSGGQAGPRSEGVGLTNTRKRLRRMYGDDHHFALTNGDARGAVAVLDIPFRQEEV